MISLTFLSFLITYFLHKTKSRLCVIKVASSNICYSESKSLVFTHPVCKSYYVLLNDTELSVVYASLLIIHYLTLFYYHGKKKEYAVPKWTQNKFILCLKEQTYEVAFLNQLEKGIDTWCLKKFLYYKKVSPRLCWIHIFNGYVWIIRIWRINKIAYVMGKAVILRI